MVPSRSSRATATVRASRMLWAEGIRVAVLNSGFGCMVNARGPEPRDTVLHGSGSRAHWPLPRPGSSGADVIRASELQHAVEDVDTDIDLGHATPVRARA